MQTKKLSAIAILAVMAFTASCTKEPETGKPSIQPIESTTTASRLSADDLFQKDVKKATVRFHSTTQAIAAGYVPSDHCVSIPGVGGMGMHWVNPTLVDGAYDPLKPEALLYAPGADGKPELIGLEYIVINTGQQRPSFGSQLFDINGVPGLPPHYSLHVWMYKHNPAGMFQPFNPNVSCQ